MGLMPPSGRSGCRTAARTAWSLVVPLKPLAVAKSRLAGAAGSLRPGLALAFAVDTVAAALACPAVREVLVVTDDPTAGVELRAAGAAVAPDLPAAGLNAAFEYGAEQLRRGRAGTPVAGLSADLPALRPTDLDRVLAAAAVRRRAFVADAARVGTTLLAATGAVPLAPSFGEASRRRHLASGAWEILLPDIASVRLDVDTAADLRKALALGVGPRTTAMLAAGADHFRPAKS